MNLSIGQRLGLGFRNNTGRSDQTSGLETGRKEGRRTEIP